MTSVTTTAFCPPLADGTLVINLDQRPERMVEFARIAAETPLISNWQRLPGVSGVDLPGYGATPWFRQRKRDKCWAGRAGCLLSHRKALLHAQSAGWERVLILEDDVRFTPDFTDRAEALTSILDSPEFPWEICYLGFTGPISPCRQLTSLWENHSLCQIFGCSTTHAYLVKQEAYSWILDQLPDETTVWPWIAHHRAIDRWYSRHLSERFNVLAISPSVVAQDSDFSDIGQRPAGIERYEGFFAGLPSQLLTQGTTKYRLKHRLRLLHMACLNFYDAARACRKAFTGL